MPVPQITGSGIVLFKNNKKSHFHVTGSNFDTAPNSLTVQLRQKNSSGTVIRTWNCKPKPHSSNVFVVKATLQTELAPSLNSDESGTVEITVTNASGGASPWAFVSAMLLVDEIT
jgi:hypothetical protein